MSLKQYREEIHNDERYSPMSPEEEKRLARLAKKGDVSAETEFVERNLRLVLSISDKLRNKYQLSDDEQLDMIQTGTAKPKDYLRGFKSTYRFSTYCYKGLTRDMRMVMEGLKHIRIPAHIMGLSRKIYAVSEKYFNEHGKYPTNEELAEIIDETPEQIEHVLSSLKNTRSVSKDTPISHDSEASIEDFLEGKDGNSVTEGIADQQMKCLLVRYLNRLTETQRMVIIERYFHNSQLQEIANKFSMRLEPIRQAHALALRRMRQFILGDKTSSSIMEFQHYLRQDN